MTVVAFLSGNDGVSGNVGTVAVTIPSTAVAGQVAVVVTEVNNAGAQTAPSGWNLKSGPDNNQNNLVTKVWTRTLTSGDVGATRTWTAATSGRFLAAGVVMSGVTESGLLIPAPTQDTTADTTLTPPALTTGSTPPQWEIVGLWCLRATAAVPATVTVPSTHTLDGSVASNTGSSPNWTVAVTHRTGGGSASTQYGTMTATASASTTDNNYTLAFPSTSVDANPPAATATARATAQAGTGPSGVDANPPSATARVTAAGQAPALGFQLAAIFTAFGGQFVRPGTAVPNAGAPTVPLNVQASLSSTTLTVTWATPASDNGSAITGYTVTNITTGVTQNLGVVTSTTFTVTAGGSYKVSVAAVNAIGTGPAALASVSGATAARFPGDTRPLVTGKIVLGDDEPDGDPTQVSSLEFFAPEAGTGALTGSMRRYFTAWSAFNGASASACQQAAQKLARGKIPWLSMNSSNWVTDADGRNNAVADTFIAWAETTAAGPVWFTIEHEPDAGTKVPNQGSYADWLNLQRWFRGRMNVYATAHGPGYLWKNLTFAPIFTAQGYANGDVDLFIPNPATDKATFDLMGADPYVLTHSIPGFTPNLAKAAAWSKKYGWALALGEYSIMNDDPNGAQKMQDWFDTCTNGQNDIVLANYFNSGVLNNSQAAYWPIKNIAANGFMGNKFVALLKDARTVHFWDLTRPDGVRYTKPAGL